LKDRTSVFHCLLAVILCACSLTPNTAGERIEGQAVPAAQSSPNTGAWNLAYKQIVRASGLVKGFYPERAVDGLYRPYDQPPDCWAVEGGGEQWIEVKLPDEALVERIEVLLGLGVPGLAMDAFGRLPSGKLEALGSLGGSPDGNGVVSLDLGEPVAGLSGLRMVVPEAPSWLCFPELGVIGRVPEETPPDSSPIPSCIASPDLIYHNANIITMDDDRPRAQALAIKAGWIAALGSDADILALANECTDKIIDLDGRTIVPGFIDSHGHWIGDAASPYGFSHLWIPGAADAAVAMIDLAISRGWTSIDTLFNTEAELAQLRSLDAAGSLRLRVNAYITISWERDHTSLYPTTLSYTPGSYMTPRVHLPGVKIYVGNAWGDELYWDTQAELDDLVKRSNQDGWQVAAHAVQREAVEMILSAYESAAGPAGDPNPLRNRIEHAVQVTDDQMARMRAAEVIASVQLVGPADWPLDPTFPLYLGDENAGWLMRWRDFVEAGILTVGSLDVPWNETVDPSPLRAMYEAVTRDGYLGRAPEAWETAQTLTAEQALRLLTIDGAYATFEEDVKGSLRAGKWADLVILSDDPLAVAPAGLLEIQVIMTMISGRAEYCTADPGLSAYCP
jgi:predicted amidohydrolase YtcJ